MSIVNMRLVWVRCGCRIRNPGRDVIITIQLISLAVDSDETRLRQNPARMLSTKRST